MINLFPKGIALISPQHFGRALARYGLTTTSSLTEKFLGGRIDDDGDEDNEDDEENQWWRTRDIFGAKLPAPSRSGVTAVIPIKGVLTAGLHPVYRVIGYEDANMIAGWVRDAAADDSIEQILLDIDSPGGMVTGVPELGEAVDAASQVKEVLAHSAGMMCSAAYWAASQADAVYCTPSADVGSIGVYQVTEDWSQFFKEMGVELTIFKSGDLKATGHPDFPLTKEQKEYLQAEVDLIGEQFRGAVKSKRTRVSADSMLGQSFLGIEAAERNLVAACKPFSALL